MFHSARELVEHNDLRLELEADGQDSETSTE
jgi:hypothetical protein